MTIDDGIPDRQLRSEINQSAFKPNEQLNHFNVLVTQSASSRTWNIPVHRKMSIHDLMSAVEDKTGIKMDRKWLVYGGRQLAQMSSLSAYPEIREGVTILINDRMRGGKKQ
jgi:hypothetical protein